MRDFPDLRRANSLSYTFISRSVGVRDYLEKTPAGKALLQQWETKRLKIIREGAFLDYDGEKVYPLP